MSSLKEFLFSITRKDLILQFFKGSGAGGQKRNKTSSAVRIQHPESGAVAECQEERSQSVNRSRAFKKLVEHPKFKSWLKLKTASVLYKKSSAEEKVNSLMRPDLLKIEHFVRFTCDKCGRQKSIIVSEEKFCSPEILLPDGWTFVKADSGHYCNRCSSKKEVMILHLTGDLVGYSPSAQRDYFIDQLNSYSHYNFILLDLSEIGRLSSWGELRIKSFIYKVSRQGGKVVLIIDPSREAIYGSLKISSGVPFYRSIEDAIDKFCNILHCVYVTKNITI